MCRLMFINKIGKFLLLFLQIFLLPLESLSKTIRSNYLATVSEGDTNWETQVVNNFKGKCEELDINRYLCKPLMQF